jgi:hypothetical protein
VLASACAFVFFAIGAAAPIWTVQGQYTPEEIASGKTRIFYQYGPIWIAPKKLVDRSPFRQRNIIRGAILTSVVTIVWLLIYRAALPRKRAESRGDYEERADGSIKDGRAGPTERGKIM